jgi:hypothetical protein
MGEPILNLGADSGQQGAFVQESAVVQRQSDPAVNSIGTPTDFSAQFPTPLDTTEIISMCEEINMWRSLPEQRTGLKQYTWREMTSLAFTSGSAYVAFADGACPEEYTHDGGNTTIDLKNIGAHKSLMITDILHSMASIQAGYGINKLVDGYSASEGLPGGTSQTPFITSVVTDLKAKEMQLAATLVMNGWDRLLVAGNASSNSLEFSGIEKLVSTGSAAHSNTFVSGTFSATEFDRFLAEACAKPTHIFGHPQAVQEMLMAYLQLGYANSQTFHYYDGNNVTPGFNFAGEVNTSVGRLVVVADANFARTDMGGGTFRSKLYALRMTHNGEPLVYKITQIPLSFRDLVPGCTAIQFEIWAKTALIVKALCAQNVYDSVFAGSIVSSCVRVG